MTSPNKEKVDVQQVMQAESVLHVQLIGMAITGRRWTGQKIMLCLHSMAALWKRCSVLLGKTVYILRLRERPEAQREGTPGSVNHHRSSHQCLACMHSQYSDVSR